MAIGALIDSVVYLATTDNASLGGLASAVTGGAVESAINPLAKLGKISKLANAATKVVSKFSKARRWTKRVATKNATRARGGETSAAAYGRMKYAELRARVLRKQA